MDKRAFKAGVHDRVAAVANTSQHLQVLRRAGLVAATREGRHVRYHLADGAVGDLSVALRAVAAARDAEIGRLARGYFGDRSGLDAVSLTELAEGLRQGQLVVIDVRPAEEFAAAHVPGARPVPLDRLDEAIAELPRDRTIVAYCRGPYCVFADDAVTRLRAAGFDARRLDGGLPEWRAAGRPVAAA
jgi:rhodanese-related sulfurtransferase